MSKLGILLTFTGTPDAPTPRALRRYLKEFLSDKRVVHIPRIIWLPILFGLILTLRPRRSAKLYQEIWTNDGSPMRFTMQKLKSLLQEKLTGTLAQMPILVEIGMNYGKPSIEQGLENLRQQQVDTLMVLPLFPQYSNTTTASTFDRVNLALKKWPALPEIFMLRDYAHHLGYIKALSTTLLKTWKEESAAQHLLISFHGIPKRFVQKGDPYQTRCERTAQLLAEELKLSNEQWTLCYQSQFGYDKWLKPSTQHLFTELPKRGIKNLDVICPGFPIDCLETLEEIALRGKKTFIQHGGNHLRYIPALNDSDLHIEMLAELLQSYFCHHSGRSFPPRERGIKGDFKKLTT